VPKDQTTASLFLTAQGGEMAKDATKTHHVINDHGTLLNLTDEQYERTYKDAGFRPLKPGEIPPIQQAELDAMGISSPSEAALAETPNAEDVKTLRRAQAKHDGA